MSGRESEGRKSLVPLTNPVSAARLAVSARSGVAFIAAERVWV